MLCNLYVDKVYEESKVAHKPIMLDSNDLGGVHADICSPFLNLHNPLAVYQPMTSETILPASINYIRASYFWVAELNTSNKRKKSFHDMPLIWDTWASIGLTPFRSDFVDYQKLNNVTVKDIAHQNKVLGVGTVMWKFITRDGREVFLPLICYHVEYAAIRLMSPQLYFKRHGGYGTGSNHNVTFHCDC